MESQLERQHKTLGKFLCNVLGKAIRKAANVSRETQRVTRDENPEQWRKQSVIAK